MAFLFNQNKTLLDHVLHKNKKQKSLMLVLSGYSNNILYSTYKRRGKYDVFLSKKVKW